MLSAEMFTQPAKHESQFVIYIFEVSSRSFYGPFTSMHNMYIVYIPYIG